MAQSDAFYHAAERRIECLTLAVGVAGALYAGWRWSWGYALGFAVGATLAWINYRWLKQGLHVLAELASAQPDPEKVRIPTRVYVKFFARYGLIVAVIYVTFSRSSFPAVAVLSGLFALVAAVILEIFYELVRGESLGAG